MSVPFLGNSQGESWNWYFGYTAGVNFPNGNAPVAVTNGMLSTLEGVATISDAAGNLLFYTHGSTVWNKLHAVMANGTGLLGNGSSTQSGVIVPHPGNPNLYYIFTCALYNQGFRYSIVDMSLAAGNGSVTVKNQMLWQNNTEKCCAVRHCNGTDIWVIMHAANGNQFRAYLVTAAGISAAPVISNVGSNHVSPGIGYLKASPNGNKLAYAVYINGFLEILDFDKSTGVVANPITINGAQYSNAYGCEFSPDNTKVYFGSYSTKKITQVNLCAGTPAQIIASQVDVGTSANSVGALQLGPDGKIWVARSQSPNLGVINNPNVAGVGCNYVDAGVGLAGKNCGAGLPNFIASYFDPPPPPFTSTVNCLNVNFTSPTVNVISCSSSSNAITSYSWNFGDSASGPSNTSANANPSHSFSGPGTFTVQLILGYACGSDTLEQPVTVISCSPMVSVNSETICSGSCAALTATANGGTPPYTYTWVPNIGAGAGPHNVCPMSTTVYTVLVSDADNNVVSNTSTVTVNITPTMVVTPSSPTLCMNDYNGSVNTVTLTGSGATTYTWVNFAGSVPSASVGSVISATAIPASNSATGTLMGSNATCTASVDFTLGILPNPIISTISGTMCFGTSAQISASGANSYVWSPATNLSSTTGATVTANPSVTTIYSVIGNSLNCFSQAQTATVDVSPNPTITLSADSPTICAGSSVGLHALGASSYVWSPAASLNSDVIPDVIANPMNTTVYTVIGTLNTCTATAAIQVSVIPVPVLNISAGKTVLCQGDKTKISVNGASNYFWSPPLGLTGNTGSSNDASPNVTTVYNIIGSNGQCTGTIDITIEVIPNPDLTLSTSNNKICKGNTTSIFANGADNYIWSPMDNVTIQNGNVAQVTPEATTNYTIIGYNQSGSVSCAVTKEIEITVVPQVTASVSNSVEICEGTGIRLNAAGGDTYLWTPSVGVQNPNQAQTYFSPTATTDYTVHVSNGGNCGSTATLTVKVHPLPTVNAGPDATFNADEPMHLYGSGTGTLKWIEGEKVICQVCPTTQIMPENSGCYKLLATSDFGCKSSDEVCITVTKNHNIYIPSVFTPNGDGLNDVFLVYGTGFKEITVSVFDRWGEKLFLTEDQTIGWDGTYKGVLSKEDVYTYLVEYTALDGKKYTKSGHVTLMK